MARHAAALLCLALALPIGSCERWVQAALGDSPLWPNAVSAGMQITTDGNETKREHYYVGRAYHFSNIVPCKVEYKVDTNSSGPAWGVISLRDFYEDIYEVLVADDWDVISWLPGGFGDVPVEAKPTGIADNGEPLYTCRAQSTDWGLLPGSLQPSYGSCRINFDGQKESSIYEIMVLRRK